MNIACAALFKRILTYTIFNKGFSSEFFTLSLSPAAPRSFVLLAATRIGSVRLIKLPKWAKAVERDWHVRVRTCMLACVCCSVVIIVVSGRLDGRANENEMVMLMLLFVMFVFCFFSAYYRFVSHEAFDVRLRH